MTVDSNGNIWFTETAIDSIGEFDPSTGTFVTQTLLTAVSSRPHGDRLGQYRAGILDDRTRLEPDHQFQPGHLRLAR